MTSIPAAWSISNGLLLPTLSFGGIFTRETWQKILAKPKQLMTDYRQSIQTVSVYAHNQEVDSSDYKLPGLVKVLHSCPRLTVLHLNLPVINDDGLWSISASCKQLVALSLVSGSHSSGFVSDDGLMAVVKNCRHIKHLRLKSARNAFTEWGFTERGFRAVAEAYRGQLRTFALEWTGLGLARLVHVDTEDDKRIKEALGEIITANPQLRSLQLDWPVAIDDTLQVAADTLTKLNHLRLGNIINTRAASTLLELNPHLESVTLTELPTTNPIADFLTPLLPHANLTTLTLDGIGFLSTLLPTLAQFPNLTHIHATPSRRAASVHHHLVDAHVALIAQACHNLQSLTVPIATDGPLLKIAGHCPHLTHLDLRDGKDITDSALTLLVRRCTRVTSLHLGALQNTRITDASTTQLAHSLPHLQHLSLPFANNNITHRTLAALAEHCPDLETLMNVPARVGYGALVKYVPMIRRLGALGLCVGAGGWKEQLGREEVEELRARCGRLRSVTYIG
ncbi:uncharacterized protein EV422DRAFT_263870 [Fimicolochytrium jonesii]|uniref:uncharacterized protein n=1 Tax=Fimicolochytrium jonesii TaxID=1396493 RepID=UPI0022FDB47E|nr:uncharacterized protein EV422DRAFT_263870 [Fimicolochytrium jonesii]KAI8817069.1 hypothetical protein EV422DRAFT_263870 [Fimicolochytrium jonesii]